MKFKKILIVVKNLYKRAFEAEQNYVLLRFIDTHKHRYVVGFFATNNTDYPGIAQLRSKYKSLSLKLIKI